MAIKNLLVYFFIFLLSAFPAYGESVSLNKWVLNVTIHEDGYVENTIQIEIENMGPAQLDGFSFVVPSSRVVVLRDQIISIPATGEVVELQAVPEGMKVSINFNRSVEAGKKWNGRLSFTAENWAAKQGVNYSIDIPIEAPQAIVSGVATQMSIPGEAEIRGQVFLPKGIEVTSVSPKPFKILFQYDRMVPTWSPDNLKVGDTIILNGSYSDTLHKIVEVDEKLREFATRIEEAKALGVDVSEAEAHLANAQNYNNQQALGEFWKKEYAAALEYVGYADAELNAAEMSLSSAGKPEPQATEPGEKTPGFGALMLILAVLIPGLVRRERMKKL